ncbi:hypothetical protein F511_30834 [Dorcoceras hygrometricum]|uniref:Uncharacterized protein n=1 Tax=Dorcoceras hygrometricum TaxID=472368 RepID=A0A2Z7ADD5_9LAMI|nr:hypothetical protein F511_30834 [Dorcoceras hygrometricum]
MDTVDVGTSVGDPQLQSFDTTDSRTDASADYIVTEPVEEMEMAAVEQYADEAMSLEEILMTIPVDCPLPSAEGEVTKIQLGQSISIPGVDEGDWYKASLPKIPAVDKGKAPLMERDPIKGNPIKEQLSLILADIEVLVQLREQIIDDVDRFFNSFSLKKLAALQTDDISAKEELVLSWAEAESTRVDLNRKTYILTKYRELLIRKFLEAHRANFVPGDGSSAVDLKILDKLSSLHLFLVEELKIEVQAHGLKWDRTCCSQIFEGRPRDRGAVIAQTNSNTRSTCWIRTMILVDGVWVVEPDISVVEPVSVAGFRRTAITVLGWYQICTAFARFCLFNGLSTVDIRNFVSSIAEDRSALRVIQSVNRSVFVSPHVQSIASSTVEDQHVQRLLDQCSFSSSSSDESSMHFNDTNAVVTSLSLPTVATDVPDAFAQLRASIDKLPFEQIRRKDDVDKLRDTLLMHILDLEKKFTERFDAHDRTYRVLLNNIHHDARDHKNLLSLDIKSSQQKLSTQVAASAFDTVDVRKVVKELDTKVTFLDGQVAAIRNDLLNFHAKAEENHLNLSTQLGFLIDYINRGGDAKKGEGGSSRPQPPPDDQSRPSGRSGGTSSRAGDQSRSRGNISREDRSRGGESSSERRRPDDRSGHSKRRRSDSGESGMDSGLPPKRGYQWLLFGE